MLVFCGAALLFLPAKGGFEITFLDVGQGDCIHIKSAAGHHYLVDGGSSSVSKAGVYRIIPYLKYQGADEVEAVLSRIRTPITAAVYLSFFRREKRKGSG